MDNKLPAGWSIRNSTGAWAAPSHPDDDSDNDGDEGENVRANFRGAVGAEDGLTEEDLRPDSPGWEDVEDDSEKDSYQCLLCEVTKSKVREVVEHGKDVHNFDFDKIRKDHSLDFFGTLQLINYIRTAVKQHDPATLDFANLDKATFVQDQYMQPTMEDDALLYSIDDLADPNDPKDPLAQQREDDAEAQAGEGGGSKVLAERALRQ
ncbi:hypothetical protein LTR62_002708 [Meristemomyces frigidus]|uniref:type I protein arginine methyltransferase n=1 Tax=Meristemomyces frigidus TaxID=1508187 RepID=A0AAN7TJA4_9PEZI|nr:hypothetical protein LTR62_002708 [Meristemomyces frigidus]